MPGTVKPGQPFNLAALKVGDFACVIILGEFKPHDSNTWVIPIKFGTVSILTPFNFAVLLSSRNKGHANIKGFTVISNLPCNHHVSLWKPLVISVCIILFLKKSTSKCLLHWEFFCHCHGRTSLQTLIFTVFFHLVSYIKWCRGVINQAAFRIVLLLWLQENNSV